MRNDRRIKAIRSRMGAAGYGLLMMVMEVLTDADHTQLSTDELELELLAGDLGVSVTEIDSLIQIAEKVGFFARSEEGFLTCPDLSKALEPVFEKRNRARNAASTPKLEVPATVNGVSVTETTQSKVKESKGEKSKEEKLQQKGQGLKVAGVVDAFSFSKNKINSIREEIRSASMLREQTCMSLRITVDFYANLVEGFFDEQIALAEAGDTINYEGLRSHFKNWTRKQVALGKDSRFHSAFKPVPVSGNTNGNNGRYGPPQAIVTTLRNSIPD